MLKNMKKAIWAILLLGNISISQNLLDKLAAFEESARAFSDVTYFVEGVEGHQFLLDDWGSGKIIINDSISVPQARVQYNMVYGEPIIGIRSRKKMGFVLKDKTLTGFQINNTNFIRVETDKFLDVVDRNYFITPIISKENYLLIHYIKTIKKPTYVSKNSYSNSNTTALKKKYITIKKYYILNPDNKYINVRLKEKDILKILLGKKKELKNYIKKNKLSLKNEKDVIKVMEYYYSL